MCWLECVGKHEGVVWTEAWEATANRKLDPSSQKSPKARTTIASPFTKAPKKFGLWGKVRESEVMQRATSVIEQRQKRLATHLNDLNSFKSLLPWSLCATPIRNTKNTTKIIQNQKLCTKQIEFLLPYIECWLSQSPWLFLGDNATNL